MEGCETNVRPYFPQAAKVQMTRKITEIAAPAAPPSRVVARLTPAAAEPSEHVDSSFDVRGTYVGRTWTYVGRAHPAHDDPAAAAPASRPENVLADETNVW